MSVKIFNGKSIALFIMCYNEEETIEAAATRTLAVLKEFSDEVRVVVIDDGSRDKSPEILDRLAATDRGIQVIRHPQNQGIGAVLFSGYKAVQDTDLAGYVCADLQFHPEDFRLLLPRLLTHDLVCAVREKRNDNLFRRLLSSVANGLGRALFGISVKDVNWVKVYRSWVVRDVPWFGRSSLLETELVARARRRNAKILNVPAPHYPREHGQAKGASVRHFLAPLKELFILYFHLNYVPKGDAVEENR